MDRQYIFPVAKRDVQRYKTVGISFKNDILTKIDSERGLIPRSVFLSKILEQTYTNSDVSVMKNAIPQILPKVEAPRESVIPTSKGDLDPHG